MAILQLKGSTLLWWKALLLQLGIEITEVSWEIFEERFWKYLSEEFIERKLNEFNSLRQGGRSVPEYEAKFMELLRYAPHLSTEKLRVNKFVCGLNFNIREKVRILMPRTLHEAVQKAIIAEEEFVGGGQSRPPRSSGAVVQKPGVQSASASRPATERQNSFKSPTAGSQRHAPGGQRPPYRPPMQSQY